MHSKRNHRGKLFCYKLTWRLHANKLIDLRPGPAPPSSATAYKQLVQALSIVEDEQQQEGKKCPFGSTAIILYAMQSHAMASILLLLITLFTASYPGAVNGAPAGSQQQETLSTNIVTDAINVSYAWL